MFLSFQLQLVVIETLSKYAICNFGFYERICDWSKFATGMVVGVELSSDTTEAMPGVPSADLRDLIWHKPNPK
jgi:Zn-dependent M28 family amino/carboxypeptidase